MRTGRDGYVCGWETPGASNTNPKRAGNENLAIVSSEGKLGRFQTPA